MGLIVLLKEKECKVIASDVSEKCLKATKDLGAGITVNLLEEDLTKIVLRETNGIGADVVVASDNKLIGTLKAMECVKRAGRIWLAIGICLKPRHKGYHNYLFKG